MALTGSTLKSSPKTRIRTIAETNSGTAVSESPVSVITRSVSRPRRSAATTPPRMLSGTTSTNATAASLSELTSDGPSSDETDTWYSPEVPRLPWTKFEIQLAYCVYSGRSTPSWWLRMSTDCWVANGPSTLRPMSPGSSCATANTITLTRNSVMIARPRRLSRKRAITSSGAFPSRAAIGAGLGA